MITAKVINLFKETEHDDHVYKAGDSYPAKGYEATKKRVEFLAQIHPKYKKAYLSDVEEKEVYPKATGGGWFELSNGEKVQGKDEALEAESALRGE